jgi:hypothetical protein
LFCTHFNCLRTFRILSQKIVLTFFN